MQKRERMKLVFVGVLLGACAAMACADGFPAPAFAQSQMCTQWEIAPLRSEEATADDPMVLPAGWEPFGVSGAAYVLRRCVE